MFIGSLLMVDLSVSDHKSVTWIESPALRNVRTTGPLYTGGQPLSSSHLTDTAAIITMRQRWRSVTVALR